MEITDMDTNKGTGITAVKASSTQPTTAELLSKIAELEAKLAAPKGTLTIKINVTNADGTDGKGTIAVYGLGRFPVSLYAEQWERLLTDENVKTILTLAKSPLASRKDRTAKVAANGSQTGANAQQTAPQPTPQAANAA